ncbi:MAG: response regulator [Candidatus Dadabacteria bacterium]|nr:MAG: response regulator [Candidatus Dadabacteria bacterium]
MRALVVEDNPDNTRLLEFLLTKHGFEVVCAATGAEGLAAARAGGVDVVLLDIQLPDLDGTEVLERLRADPRTAGLPVIAVTSYAMSGDRERLLARGCDGYLEKPIDPMGVIDQIRAILEGRHERAGR